MDLNHTEHIHKKETGTEENKILLWCSYCGQKYRLGKKLAGKTGTCDECHNEFAIPYVSQTEPKLKKTISFLCEHCDTKLLKPQELAGIGINCHECGNKIIVPEAAIEEDSPANLLEPFIVAETTRTDITAISSEAEIEPEEDRILFWCNHCGQKYRLPQYLVGKAGVCIKCQNYLFIPHASQTKPDLEDKIVFPCKYCGQKLRKAQRLVDTEVKCHKCRRRVIVPKKSKISSLPQIGSRPEERILFWCRYCAQKYRLPQNLAGKTGTCDRCQKSFIIPQTSQTKADLQKTIIFPCEHCGKDLWETQELAGVKVQCSRCGEESIVPEKQINSEKIFAVSSSAKTAAINLLASEQPIRPSKAKAIAAISSSISLTKDAVKTPVIHKRQITITNNPPIIYRIKNYFHKKKKKSFISTIFFVFIDNIVDAYESSRLSKKTFL